MSEEQHVIVSWQAQRIRNIADELDAYLESKEPDAVNISNTTCSDREVRELHKLRGYCEQLRCDAENIKNGVDGSKGVREVTNE